MSQLNSVATSCSRVGAGGNTEEGQKLRIAGLFCILATSAIGVSLPLLSRGRFPAALFIARCFGAGVVLATGFAHVLFDSMADLQNPCLGWNRFYPFSMVIAAYSALATFALEMAITAFFKRRMGTSCSTCPTPSQVAQMEADVEQHSDAGSTADEAEQKQAALDHLEATVVSYVLEAGMLVHSFTIGIAFGANTDVNTIVALIVALCFHQGLDGVALGATFAKAAYSPRKYLWFAAAFVLVTPAGCAVGLGLGTSYNPHSSSVLAIQGILNAISAGILVYNGLVDLLIPAFNERPGGKERSAGLKTTGYVSLLLGCAAMCIVAKWA